MNALRFLASLRRRITIGFRALVSLPHTLNLTDRVIHAFAFPQHDWAKRLRQSLAEDTPEATWREWTNPLFWIVWSYRFFVGWLNSRPYMTLTPALPAILVGIFLLATVVVIVRRDPSDIQTVYLDTLKTSLTSGNFSQASVAAQRLLAMDPQNLEYQYQLAILNDELGKQESARRSIVRLALQKRYGPAALWILNNLVYEESTKGDNSGSSRGVSRSSWTQDEQKLCHHCATVAMTNLPSKRALFAKRIYAEFLTKNGQVNDALRIYETIEKFDPQISLVAAQLANQLGDHIKAQQHAKAAIRFLEPQLLSDPTNTELRLRFVQALVFDEQDDRAYKLVLDALQHSPNDPRLHSAAGEVLIFKSDRMARTLGVEETLLTRAQLLIQALRHAPKSPLVLEAVVQLAIECGEADTDRLKRVREALLQGVSPAAMHFVEGTVLLMAGENEAARQHLELAADEGTNMAGLLNNLAFALSESGDEHLEQALRFSNEALRQLAGHPYLLETRGRIYLKMKRYKEAIADLEKALAAPEIRSIVHRQLADAYDALGMTDLAQQNRSRANGVEVSAPNL